MQTSKWDHFTWNLYLKKITRTWKYRQNRQTKIGHKNACFAPSDISCNFGMRCERQKLNSESNFLLFSDQFQYILVTAGTKKWTETWNLSELCPNKDRHICYCYCFCCCCCQFRLNSNSFYINTQSSFISTTRMFVLPLWIFHFQMLRVR